MSAVIGLAVARDELRAVLLRDGEVRWAVRAGRTEEPSLSAQIVHLLARAPARRWGRQPVIAAVGPSAAQVKRLSGLPPLDSASALARIVCEGAGRFFLKNGVPLEISGVRIAEPGAVWVAAFDAPVVTAIVAGCRAARRHLYAVMPATTALVAALGDSHVVWRDGDVAVEIVVANGALITSRRVAMAADSAPLPSLPAALSALGEDAWRFADAYGAALVPRTEPLALRPGARGETATSRRRLGIASAACAFAAALALTAPALWGAIDAVRAERALVRLAPRAREAAAVEQELRRMTGALNEVGSFVASRRSPTRLLAGLTRALPAGAALVTLRVDSAGGMLVLLAPRAARAISALDSMPGITAPEIVGPVTREVVGARELERATVRFRVLAEGSP